MAAMRRMIDDALAAIDAPAFSLQLHGVGQFGNKQPHALWAAVRANRRWSICSARWTAPSAASASRRTRHKFTPHVTLARLRHPDTGKVVEWLTYHALYTSAEFRVGAFHLYSSMLTSDGSIYRVEQDYPLENGYDGEIGD